MAYGDGWWRFSRLCISPLSIWATRARGYGLDRMPKEGGLRARDQPPRLDRHPPRRGALAAQSQLRREGRGRAGAGVRPVPGWSRHDSRAPRRVRSRRGAEDAAGRRRRPRRRGLRRGDAAEVRPSRQGAAGRGDGRDPGERAGRASAVYGTQFWRLGNFAPCSIALGEPFLLEGYPPGGRGYKEASLEIERRINVLFDWLADVHARGRPPGETPPL